MPRELSPELLVKTGVTDQGRGAKPLDMISDKSAEPDFRRQVNYQLELIRRSQRETNEKVETLARSLRQTQEVQRQKSEQLHHLQKEIEQFVQDSLQKLSSKFSVSLGRMQEKISNERQVQEMLDRHNQIVQKFEMKLSQMQSLMGEQEIKLLSYSDTLKEIRRQLQARP